MKIGLHLSLEGDVYETIKRAVDNNMTAVSVMFNKPKLEKMKLRGYDIPVVVHASYRMNPANPLKMNAAEKALQNEVECAEALGAACIVIHPGSAVGVTQEEGVRNLITVLNKLKHNIPIAVETMAGKGNEIGSTLEQIQEILNNTTNVGVCLDTCHLHDAGYSMDQPNTFVTLLSEYVDLEKVLCVHVNNSKNPQGSHKDRHAYVQQEGFITVDALRRLTHNSLLQHVPMIVEKYENLESGLSDIEVLRNIG